MDSVYEQERAWLEELDRTHRACVDELTHIAKTVRLLIHQL